MQKERYLGSVRFFKHLYLAILALLIIVPTCLAIGKGVALKRAKAQLAAYEEPKVVETVEEKQQPAGEPSAREIIADAQIISHGLGSTDGVATLNCREGFEEHYNAGVRVFEADIRMTSDGRAVLRHDWRANMQDNISETYIPTYEEFLSLPIDGKYAPMSFCDLLKLMEEYPDICVITDTKFYDCDVVAYQFGEMVKDAKSLGLSYLFNRMIIQVYTEQMFSLLDSTYAFPHYIYTLYNEGFDCTEDAFRAKAEFCKQNDIIGITMWDWWWDSAYYYIADWRGLKTFVHTVNDADTAKSLLARGVSGVYTDTLKPDDIAG